MQSPQDRDAALEFIRAHAIPELPTAVTREAFEPGGRIGAHVAAEIAFSDVKDYQELAA